ncbi:solute carrier family 2, facilitated glucose transporter member 10-like [Scleropages formosus]|uniref:Solute carrier family 2, facilitated glucose transporter member 10 n=1 Tax=Scleropages formosus TaxID=113540 RepID=A0A0P7X031_SCLFO|nr:solute carrier family 2, facilitated glucose transporter member 10-like [Scleropages formosus]
MGCSVLALTTLVSTLGGLVFGYELAIISGALLQLQAEFHLSCFQQEAVVSALLIGGLLASAVGGVLIDRHGRRTSILLSNLLIQAGSVVLVASRSVPTLAVGRVAVGFAMSLSSMSCCIFVSEMVSPERRGLLVSLYEAGITVGILAAYAMNYILEDVRGGWRYMFGLAMAPSSVQLATIWFLPSNPGKSVRDTAKPQRHSALVRFASGDQGEADMLAMNRQSTPPNGILDLFRSKDNMRTRMILGLGLVLFQQFTGQPSVLFYASTIFHSVGFQSDASAILASVGLGVMKVAATLVSMMCTDKVGRRALLIGGCTVMSASLIVIALLSNHTLHGQRRPCEARELLQNDTLPLIEPTGGGMVPLHPNSTSLLRSSQDTTGGERAVLREFDVLRPLGLNPDTNDSVFSTPAVPAGPVGNGAGNWIVLISMMAYVSAYSVGFGPMTWLVLSEIFPAWVRGRAFALTTCFNWAANLIITFSFLNVIDALGISRTFLLYGLIGVVAVLFIYTMLPETKGKSLEEIDKELSRKR